MPPPRLIQVRKPATPAQAPTRRLNLSSAARTAGPTEKAKQEAARASIREALQAMATNNAKLDKIVDENAKLTEQIAALMADSGVSLVLWSGLIAEYAERFGRPSREVNPKQFKAKVADKDFWAAVKIPVGAAEKLLSAAELNKIVTTTPAASLGKSISIREHKK